MPGTPRIVTTKTPLRITFAGGGTDFPEYFNNYGNGATVSATINRYIYVTVAQNFYKDEIRISYSKTENALKSVNQIEHPTVREAMRMLGIKSGIQVVSITEIPSGGTGLGSSSAFLVGLLNALHTWIGETVSPNQLAEEAVKIERNVLGEPGGWQDQYSAAFGGLNLFEFKKNNRVFVRKHLMTAEEAHDLEDRVLMFYTGKERKSSSIHKTQIIQIKEKENHYEKMREFAMESFDYILKGEFQKLGEILDKNWQLKKQLSSGITDKKIDEWYNAAVHAGAYGGKLLGAGGGGFLMFLCDPDKKSDISRSLRTLMHEDLKIEPFGSRIVYLE